MKISAISNDYVKSISNSQAMNFKGKDHNCEAANSRLYDLTYNIELTQNELNNLNLLTLIKKDKLKKQIKQYQALIAQTQYCKNQNDHRMYQSGDFGYDKDIINK